MAVSVPRDEFTCYAEECVIYELLSPFERDKTIKGC